MGAENYGIAMALLKNKGVSIPDSTLARLQNERIQVLSEKKSFSPLLLLVGYFIAFIPLLRNLYGMHQYIAGPLPLIYFVWYFPGAAGILIGWIIIRAKTTLPDGSRISAYDSATIKHGITIFALNILSWTINTVMMLYVTL